MSKARNIADLGSNDVLDTTASGVSVTGTVSADGISSSQDIQITESIPQLVLNDTDGTDIKGTIAQAGTNLFLRSRGGTSSYGGIQFARNNGSDIKTFEITPVGDIKLYKDDGSTVGLDFDASTSNVTVNGTVTAGGLTVEGSSAQNVILKDDDSFSGADNQIKLAITPSVSDGNSAGIAFGTYSDNDYWKQGIFWQRSGSYGVGDLIFANRESADTTTVSDADQRMRIAKNGDITIYKDDGSTAGLTFDASSGNSSFKGATTTIGSGAASTNVELNLDGVASKAQRIQFREGATNRWLLGQGAASETSAFELYNATGTIALKFDRGTNVATFASGAVFNEDGLDQDFRVESNNNAHALFVDAGADKVKFGTRVDFSDNIIGDTAGKYLQFQGSSSQAIAIGATGGNNSPSTASGTFGVHKWNGSSWDEILQVNQSQLIGNYFHFSSSEFTGDMNNLFRPGSYRIANGTTNAPTGTFYAATVFGNGGNVTTQIATQLASTVTYVRSYNTSWTSWARLDT